MSVRVRLVVDLVSAAAGLTVGAAIVGLVWGQALPALPATPCDVQVQIVEQGRRQAEQNWAAAFAQVQELQRKVATLEAATKKADPDVGKK